MKTIYLLHDQIYTGDLILVNTEHPYRASKECALESITAINRVLLAGRVVKPLSQLLDALDARGMIAAVSGWRSEREQKEIYIKSLKENGQAYTEKYVALPGCSEHETGLAIDMGLNQGTIDFVCPAFPYTGICQAFRQNAANYGFIERYPRGKERITGIAHEPWHFRYVGTPHAQIMQDNDFTMEEYIAFLNDYPHGVTYYSHSFNGVEVAVSYLQADEAAYSRLNLDDNTPYTISGNNVNGFIITEWRKLHEGT